MIFEVRLDLLSGSEINNVCNVKSSQARGSYAKYLLRGILVSLTGERGKPKSNTGDNNLYNLSFNLIPSARTHEVP